MLARVLWYTECCCESDAEGPGCCARRTSTRTACTDPLAFVFADTMYIMFVIAVLFLDALDSAGADIALYQVVDRENFGRLSMTVTGMSRCSSPHSSRIHPDLLSCHSSYRALRLPLPKYTATLPKKLSPCVELALSHLAINAASSYLLDE